MGVSLGWCHRAEDAAVTYFRPRICGLPNTESLSWTVVGVKRYALFLQLRSGFACGNRYSR